MVDNPNPLSTICLQRFASLLNDDQTLWKKHIEQRIYQNEQHRSTASDQRKRKYHRPDEETMLQSLDPTTNKIPILSGNRCLFIQMFLRGLCPLNSFLSERLAQYLVGNNQLNDFTLTVFSSNATCLKRLVLNVKYLSRLQCHVLHEHPHLTELEIIFKESTVHRTNPSANDFFYQRICPSIESKFDDIYSIYGPLVLHDMYGGLPEADKAINSSNRYLFQRAPTLSEGFSHQKLLNVILNNLHPLTFERLRTLQVAHYKFFAAYHLTTARKNTLVDMSPLTKCSTNSSSMMMASSGNFIPTNLRLLLKFTHLRSLNISNTDIKNYCLDVIMDTLESLDTLDLSSCRSLTSFDPLLKISSRLKWLNLYNCSFHLQQNPTIYQILYRCHLLDYLDISTDHANHNPATNTTDYDMNRFLCEENCLPCLTHFDMSGQKNVSCIALHKFLLAHAHLQFLGLFLTHEKYSACLFDTSNPCYSKTRRYTYDLQDIISLTITEDDLHLYEPYLIESLRRYNDRSSFVQKILYYIFFLTRSYASNNQILLLELILQTMSAHTNLQSVQMASTACIYNLTRTPLTEQINVNCLGKIVRVIIHVMELFPHQQQLQKNCLLTLCSDRILHEPNFDFHLLAALVMKNLLNYTDLAIIQPGVAILALLTTRLSVDECTQLSSVVNLQRLLQLIEQQIDRLQTIQHQQVVQVNEPSAQELNDLDLLSNHQSQLTGDDTLRFCLSLLWNLTDENPIVCERFIHSMGLHLFQRLLNLFASDTVVLTKIVGLLSNIAEVPHLRVYLYSIDIIPLMQRFLTDGIIDIAFSAAGILAHLLYEQMNHEINLELCRHMRDAILKWPNPETNMVTYRSFKPFMQLVKCTQIPVVQLWAAWAIHHVFSTDRARYSRIIREEKLYELMQKLYDDQISASYSDAILVQLFHSILHLLRPYRLNRVHNVT